MRMREGDWMELKTITLYSDEEGAPQYKEGNVDFRSNDHGMTEKTALISSPEMCRNFQFVELPVGFERCERVADLGQVAVCLAGQLRISCGPEAGHILKAGDILRTEAGPNSLHSIAVIGDVPVHLMVVQLK